MGTAGSEFSLSNPEELELDYYDYNVINSAAAPGSYLGEMLGKVSKLLSKDGSHLEKIF